jgi:CelD/BcsL family acetyltransferase involved in cellulose biosynthesis
LAPRTGETVIVSAREELRALAPEWERLASRFATPLLSHDWFLAAAETLHGNDRLAVCVRRTGGTVSAIAPLVERRVLGMRSLEVIGYHILQEPTGLLYDRPADLRGLIADVIGRGLPLNIPRMSDPVLVAELSVVEGGTVEALIRTLATSPWIRIERPWKDYYETISAKWRSAHRRAMKKAGAAGPVTFEFHSPGPAEFDSLMKLFVEVEGRSWKGRLGTALATNDPLRNFFERYGSMAAARGIARFALMRVGGTPVAGQFGVDHGGRHWLLKIGYDESYSDCSPGILLMYAALERAFNDALEGFEFLGSNESWIQVWNHRLHRYHSRSIDRAAVHRLIVGTVNLSDRIRRRIRRTLARSAKGR